ncbi:MAG: leucine-rich repeat domain-containing protein [Proteobacteria bacterium]|nr:leucine-rich repeat domain-containing protein [Pseudomonadota bacterium]
MKLGPENNIYKLLLTLLKDHLDPATIDAIRQTNRDGRDFANAQQPISLNAEGKLLLDSKMEILALAKAAVNETFSNLELSRLTALFEQLETVKKQKKHVPLELLEEINTLLAVCQLRQFDDVRLYYITRLTGTFCESLKEKLAGSNLLSLQKLTISSMGFVWLSPKIAELQQLEQITIEFGRIPKLPPEIGKLRNLKVVNIWGSKLTALPGSICDLENLKQLSVTGSYLEKLPDHIGQCQQLQVLDVSANALTALPESLSQCLQLKKLNIQSNPHITMLPSLITARLVCMDLEVFALFVAEHAGHLPFGWEADENTIYLRGNYPDFTINADFAVNNAPLMIQLDDGYPEEGFVVSNAKGETDNLPAKPDRLVFVQDDRLIAALENKMRKMKI